MDRIRFFDGNRLCSAKVFDNVPQVEELDVAGGFNQIVRFDKIIGARPAQDVDYGYYEFYVVEEYLGSQNDDSDCVEDNTDHYYAAIWTDWE